MSNNIINKVIYNGRSLIDLTSDTVTPDKLFSGVTAHSSNGQQITGTAEITVSGTRLILPQGLLNIVS